jgi:hypothetical protein
MRLLKSSFRASGMSSERTGTEYVAELRRHQDNPRYDACDGSRGKLGSRSSWDPSPEPQFTGG